MLAQPTLFGDVRTLRLALFNAPFLATLDLTRLLATLGLAGLLAAFDTPFLPRLRLASLLATLLACFGLAGLLTSLLASFLETFFSCALATLGTPLLPCVGLACFLSLFDSTLLASFLATFGAPVGTVLTGPFLRVDFDFESIGSGDCWRQKREGGNGTYQ